MLIGRVHELHAGNEHRSTQAVRGAHARFAFVHAWGSLARAGHEVTARCRRRLEALDVLGERLVSTHRAIERDAKALRVRRFDPYE